MDLHDLHHNTAGGLHLRRFPDAQQRDEPVAQGRGDLGADGLVRLAEVLAALGVADLHDPGPGVGDLGHGDLPGPGTGLGPVRVLRPDQHPGLLRQDLGHRGDRRGRGDHEGLHVPEVPPGQGLGQAPGPRAVCVRGLGEEIAQGVHEHGEGQRPGVRGAQALVAQHL